MKNLFSTIKLKQGIVVLLLMAAGLLWSGQAKACSASFTDSVSGKTVKFYNGSSATAGIYTWSFGDGSSNVTTTSKTTVPTHTYADYSKSYTACLYVYDSATHCRDTMCKTVTTGKAPCSASMYTTTSLLNAAFTDSGSTAAVAGHAHSSTWDFGDGKTGSGSFVKHTYAKSGSYSACLTVYDSVTKCSSKVCRVVAVSSCTLTVSYTYKISTRTVTFTSTTTSASKHSSYMWYFGDGSKDSTSGATVKHTYSGTGNSFSTYLIIYDSATTCTNYQMQTVVLCNVKTDFTFSTSYGSLGVGFKGDSANGTSVKYTWDFGDGSTAGSGYSVSHKYSASGKYTVCLTVESGTTGCTATYCQDVTVSSCTLTGEFSYTLSGRKVSFTGKSNSTSKHIRWYWVFGDGSKDSTSGSSVTHSYGGTASSEGVYLAIYDSSTKCSYTYSKKVYFCNLTDSFVVYHLSGQTMGFGAYSSGGSSALIYSWTLGDGRTITNASSVTYTYAKGGTYSVCLTAKDSVTGCTVQACKTITVRNCTLTASYTYKISGKKVTFSATSSATAHVKYVWSFGDGSYDSTSGKSVSHTYTGTSKTYLAYLSIYDSSSTCTAIYDNTFSLCSASAAYTYSVNGGIVTYTSTGSNASSAKYKWTFGDGNTSKDASPKHTYSKTGWYMVCLTVTDSPCTDTHCDSIFIKTLTSTWCITGTVTAGGKTTYPCKVYLITYNATDSSLKALDSTAVDSNGNYSFCGLANGTYYTKAALLATNSNYKYYIPTYHNDATKWAKAKAVTVSGADETGVDIKMVKGTNPGGAGFVGGKIKSGANKTGDPVANVLVVLYDVNEVAIASTYSDASGNYGFPGVAFGTYNVDVDIAGLPCTDAVVTVSDTQATLVHVDMLVNRTSITPAPASNLGIKNNYLNIEAANVYPNPVNEKLYVATNLQTRQMVNIRIYDITGKVITELNQDVEGGMQNMAIDASTLPQGMYFIKLQLQKDNKILEARFVKAQ